MACGSDSAKCKIQSVQLKGDKDSLLLSVDGRVLGLGDPLPAYTGLSGRLDERLLKIITLIVLRRTHEPERGWVFADELAIFVGGERSRGAVSKFLERRLMTGSANNAPLGDGEFLLQWYPTVRVQDGRIGGISRGPYRISVKPPKLAVEELACWRFLLGWRETGFQDGIALPEAKIQAEAEMREGHFLRAMYTLRASIQQAVQLSRQPPPSVLLTLEKVLNILRKEELVALGDCWLMLADVEMQMGRSLLSVTAATRAMHCYERVRHPLGVSRSYQVRSFARAQYAQNSAQAEEITGARYDAQRALYILDKTAKRFRSGIERVHSVGSIGHKLMLAGRYGPAKRKFVFAREKSEELGDANWIIVWSCRIAQVEIAMRNLSGAEQHLSQALDLSSGLLLPVPTEALLTRVNAQFWDAAGQEKEAKKWLTQAYRIGQERNMLHQLRLLMPLVQKLERVTDSAP